MKKLYSDPVKRNRRRKWKLHHLDLGTNIETASQERYDIDSYWVYVRVPTAQGKQGKWPKKIPIRENTGNLEMLPKHREFALLRL